MELAVDQSVWKAIDPEAGYYDFLAEVGLDIICCGLETYPEDITWIDREQQIFRNKWGVTSAFTRELLAVTLPPARIQSEEDLRHYTPPDPHAPHLLRAVRNVVNRFKGEKAVAFVGEEVFAVSQYLRGGLENLMFDYALDPDLVLKLAKIGEEYYIELYRTLAKEGVEIIVLGDDYAGKNGPFMSPEHFERYIFPGLKRVVKEIKGAGMFCIKHSDGNLRKILHLITETGVDGLGPLEPTEGMDLRELRKLYNGVLVGNIDVDLLSRGTEEQVRRATSDCLARVSSTGRHILSSANSISSSVDPKNFLAMIDTVKTCGKYPIEAGVSEVRAN